MKKIFISLVLILAVSAQVVLAVTTEYYSSLDSKSGSTLRSAITSLVYTHHTTALGYNWNFADMDIVDNQVLDMYSTCSWTQTDDQCGGYSGICGCYNREHIVPQSLFNEQSPQVGDRHHLFLTDGKVNGVRSNYAFGETNATTTWNNVTNGSKALGQLGAASYAYASSVTVFEPDDQYKGDIARAILYMVVRYATTNECRAYNGNSNSYPVTTWSSNEMFSGSLDTNYGLSNAAVQTFLKWHRNDPVSAKEIARNTGVENAQHNRNPFVDYPILVEYLWGKYAGETFSRENALGSFESGFEPGVSDGDKSGTPVVPYNVLWMANGSQHAEQATLPTDPDDCSASRVFVGWTGQSSVSARPDDLFTTQPTITKDTTFYAVYANASTGSGTSTSDSVTYSSVYSEDTEVEGDTLTIGSDISVVFKKGSSATKYYKSGTAIRWYGGGKCTIASSAGNITQIVLTYGSSDGSNEITSNVGTFSTNTWTGSADTVVFTQAGTNGQRRIAKIKVTYGGGTSYSNYSLSCSTPTPTPTPSTLPEYMAPPAGYYNSIEGLQDSLLKSTLGTLSNTGTRLTYGNGSKNKTWYGFYFTDRDTTNNSVIDMYSDTLRYFSTSDSTASVSGCHIEHMLPKSWWGGDDNNAYKDLYHLVPSDGQANTSKNNWGPGVPDMSYASAFNNGKFYTSRDTIHNLKRCFAPSDEYKGDFARAYFYVVTTYGDQFTWVQSALDAGMTNDSYLEFQDWLAELLMEWHRLDPVSEKEVRRAYEVNKIQGNRNPFIDYPCLAEYIWGNHKGEVVSMSSLVSGYAGMGTDCCGGGTPQPTTQHTITWSVNGETSSDEVTEGTKPTAPSVTVCVESRPFMGWTTSSSFTGEPSPLYASNAIPNAAGDATYYAVYADKSTGSGSVTDSLTYNSIGIGVVESGSATYADFDSVSITSDAVYAGNIYKFTKNSNSIYIQLKSSGSTSGIITTTSGGTATKVKVAWNSSTTTGRTIDVYGKTTAYSAASDLYDNSAKGTKIGSIVYGTSTELTITGEYTYIGLRSNSNAMYLDTIAITWSTGNVTTYDNYSTELGKTDVTASFEAPTTSIQEGQSATSVVTTNSEGTVTYSSSNTSVATVDASTGQVTAVAPGTARITATIAATNCQNGNSAYYDLTVTAIPQYTVTWKASGVTVATETVQQGNRCASVPADPSCEARVFKGWSVQKNYEHDEDAPNDLFTEVSSSPVITQDTTIYAIYADEQVTSVPGSTSYNRINSTSNLSDGEYLIVYEADSLIFNGGLTTLDAVGNTIAVTINNNSIASETKVDTATFTITAVTGDYTIQSASGYYIGQTSDANGMKSSSTTTYTNTISLGGDTVDIVSSSTHLRYNSASNQLRFRYFKSTSYLGQKAIQLYKKGTTPSTNDTTYINYSTVCAPFMALDASEITASSFVANWTYAGVDTYSLNVMTTAYESIYGYPQNVTGTSASVSGLSAETTYYYTVTPAGKSASNEISVTTLKNSVPTDIENTSEAPKARKMLINGQLFILRGEHVYTIQGIQIK